MLAAVFVFAAVGCGGEAPGEHVGLASSALTYPNDQLAFDYFLGRGLAKFQAAGVVGNLDQESGVSPTAVQSGGPGRGIAQWSVGGRWDVATSDNATWYAAKQGQSVLSLQLQLDFIWYELSTFPGYGLATLQQTTTISDATVAFQNDFEGCGTCNQSQRIANANNVLAAFGADTADAGPQFDGPSGVACTVTATNQSGQCLDVLACAALGDHISTPGYCPGPNNVECCTATTQHAGDAGLPSQPDAGTAADAAGLGDLAASDSSMGTNDTHGCSTAGDGARLAPEGVLLALLILLATRRRGARGRRP